MEPPLPDMIHLDANYLSLSLARERPEATQIRDWLNQGETLGTSAIAWMEFVTGPVPAPAVEAMRQVLKGGIHPLGIEEAELAAQLFNASGRKRPLRYDCLIAATAISARARLATANAADFRSFEIQGLLLA